MHESKRVVLASKFATKENWSRTDSEQDLVRARTCDLSMVVLYLLVFLRVALGKPCTGSGL
jgi:hypothetical protein